MKRNYDAMDAFKVTFNAKEQVAAEACQSYDAGNKYMVAAPVGEACTLSEDSSKYQAPASGYASCLVDAAGNFGPAGGDVICAAKYQS